MKHHRSFVSAARCVAALALAGGLAAPACAEDKVTVIMTWFAQAEHGGYYQAVATGIYKKYGLDVTVKSGGPQVNRGPAPEGLGDPIDMD